MAKNTELIIGGVVVVGVVAYLLYQKQQQAAQQAASNVSGYSTGQPTQNTLADLLSNIGAGLQTPDPLGGIASAFGVATGSNDPGLISSDNTNLNDPGLVDDSEDDDDDYGD